MLPFSTFIQEIFKPKVISKVRDQNPLPAYTDIRGWYQQRTVIDKTIDTDPDIGGYKPIGSGAYGRVYHNNSHSNVVKTFYTPDGKENDGYFTWLNFCINNQHNPYVPKIKGRPVAVSQKHNLYAVRIEKLLHVTSNEWWTFFEHYRTVQSGLRKDSDLMNIIGFLNKHPEMEDLHDSNVMKRKDGQIVITDPLG